MKPYLKRLHQALDERGFAAPVPQGTDPHPDASAMILSFARQAKDHRLTELGYQTRNDDKLYEALLGQARATAPEDLAIEVTAALRVLEGFAHMKTALTYDLALAARLAACVDELRYIQHLKVLYAQLNGV